MSLKIVPQMQPCEKSCVSTSIAMVLGRPVEEVRAEFHEGYMAHILTVVEYLARFGFLATPMYTTYEANGEVDDEAGLYMLSVPSMNMERATHAVLLDYRCLDDNIVMVYDPNAGKEGKKYYVNKHEEDLLENEYTLLGFSYDFQITEAK